MLTVYPGHGRQVIFTPQPNGPAGWGEVIPSTRSMPLELIGKFRSGMERRKAVSLAS